MLSIMYIIRLRVYFTEKGGEPLQYRAVIHPSTDSSLCERASGFKVVVGGAGTGADTR